MYLRWVTLMTWLNLKRCYAHNYFVRRYLTIFHMQTNITLLSIARGMVHNTTYHYWYWLTCGLNWKKKKQDRVTYVNYRISSSDIKEDHINSQNMWSVVLKVLLKQLHIATSVTWHCTKTVILTGQDWRRKTLWTNQVRTWRPRVLKRKWLKTEWTSSLTN